MSFTTEVHGKTPTDAVLVLLEQAGHAVTQARAIRAGQPHNFDQLFAADTVAAALIQQAAKINSQLGCGVAISDELVAATQIVPGLV